MHLIPAAAARLLVGLHSGVIESLSCQSFLIRQTYIVETQICAIQICKIKAAAVAFDKVPANWLKEL